MGHHANVEFRTIYRQQTSVNPNLRQNRIKLVVRMISNDFLDENRWFIRIF